MKSFLQRHAASVSGCLTGFDRVVFRGVLRNIAYCKGLDKYLGMNRVLLKDFGKHVQDVSKRMKAAGRAFASQRGRPLLYLSSPKTNKEQVALGIQEQDGVKEGLICVLTSVEPCQTFDIRKNEDGHIELCSRLRKCLFMYHYAIHPLFGLVNARIQTWFPFSVQICLNGREWLARDMDSVGLSYGRYDNCFTWLEDPTRAQEMFDGQLGVHWPSILNGIAGCLNPIHAEIFSRFESSYYWTTHQCEVATDVMFRDEEALASVYPSFVQHGITSFKSADVLRFLAPKQRLSPRGEVSKRFLGEVTSSFKERKEGVRIKHSVNGNSVKAYDKGGSVLRVETTINNPRDLKAYRPKEGDPGGEQDWRRLRKGIADLHRLSELSKASNARYLEALAAVDLKRPLSATLAPITKPVIAGGKRVRALRPFSPEDVRVFEAVSRAEYMITGFRNRDLRARLFAAGPKDRAQAKREAGRVTRWIRLLRSHGLVKKVPRSHRYQLTSKGKEVIVAVLAARAADTVALTRAA